jgi:hypothetical protein
MGLASHVEPERNVGAVAADPPLNVSSVQQGDVCAQRRTPLGDGSVQRGGGQGAGGCNVERTTTVAFATQDDGAGQREQARALADEWADRSATT